MKKLLTGCYAVLLVVTAALPALASQPAPPRYQSSEPSDGATVHQPPDRVEVTFDQPLDDSSALAIEDECGRDVDDDATEVDGNSMSIGVSKKPSGEYHVEYTAVGLGGLTGESTGHITFTAHGGKPCRDGGPGHDHGDNDDDDNGHDKHGDGNGGGDDDHGTEHGGGSTTDHGTDHSGGSTTHTDHDAGTGTGTHAGSGHGDGNDDGHAGHEGGGDENAQASGDVPGITSPDDTSRKLLSRADSSTLLLSLGLCLLLGVLGGAILRASGVR